jgi:hypothetical protein
LELIQSMLFCERLYEFEDYENGKCFEIHANEESYKIYLSWTNFYPLITLKIISKIGE